MHTARSGDRLGERASDCHAQGGVGRARDNLTMPTEPDWPAIPVSETAGLATDYERIPSRPAIGEA